MRPALGSSVRRQGLTGHGVGIAVIDSGVTAPDVFGRRLVAGPDFTADVATDHEAVDRTGHGTHLAGIVAGERTGVAPGSHVVSVKVAGDAGATDVGAVIAALDWTVAHRHQLSLGVVLLAFGADQLPTGTHDPLAAAVARAWKAGLVVVTSTGNDGLVGPLSTPTHIDEVLTVAASEQADGAWSVCDFSSKGDVDGRPDLAAPGRSIVGPIAPGTDAEDAPESSVVAPGYVKGSGTSQAAAVVAGAAALLLEADASLTPDEVKRILCTSAVRIDDPAAGAGTLDLDVALACLASGLFREVPASTLPAPADAWSGLEWAGHAWRGHAWRGLEWAGHAWRGHAWRGHAWRGHAWRGHAWRGHAWRGHAWRGHAWRGLEWRGHAWRGLEWA
ncbi:MAG: S8 family serine peptidase [Acidimicrobiales bacterium]|nr:S8 family serine peptidase [Acidimicrobiales bacterium]